MLLFKLLDVTYSWFVSLGIFKKSLKDVDFSVYLDISS